MARNQAKQLIAQYQSQGVEGIPMAMWQLFAEVMAKQKRVPEQVDWGAIQEELAEKLEQNAHLLLADQLREEAINRVADQLKVSQGKDLDLNTLIDHALEIERHLTGLVRALAPHLADPHGWARAQVRLHLGKMAVAEGKHDLALHYFEEAFRLAPEYLAVPAEFDTAVQNVVQQANAATDLGYNRAALVAWLFDASGLLRHPPTPQGEAGLAQQVLNLLLGDSTDRKAETFRMLSEGWDRLVVDTLMRGKHYALHSETARQAMTSARFLILERMAKEASDLQAAEELVRWAVETSDQIQDRSEETIRQLAQQWMKSPASSESTQPGNEALRLREVCNSINSMLEQARQFQLSVGVPNLGGTGFTQPAS
jgi:tetratricopeptide (TPR) repeat protein